MRKPAYSNYCCTPFPASERRVAGVPSRRRDERVRRAQHPRRDRAVRGWNGTDSGGLECERRSPARRLIAGVGNVGTENTV